MALKNNYCESGIWAQLNWSSCLKVSQEVSLARSTGKVYAYKFIPSHDCQKPGSFALWASPQSCLSRQCVFPKGNDPGERRLGRVHKAECIPPIKHTPILEVISCHFCFIVFVISESIHLKGGDYARAYRAGGGDR